MREKSRNLGEPSLFLICIDKREENEFAGRLYHYYNGLLYAFLNGEELISLMEQALDVKTPDQEIPVEQSAHFYAGLKGDKDTAAIRVFQKEKREFCGELIRSGIKRVFQNKEQLFRILDE